MSVIEETIAKFHAEPDAGRSAPAATATLSNGHARLSFGSFNWDADLAPALGGGGLAPSPTAYLLGALAGCAVAFLADTLAPQFGVRIDGITAVARCRADSRGLLGMDGALPDLEGIELDVEVTSPDGERALEPVLAAWRERCPIYLALLKPNAVALTTRFVAAAAA